MSTELVINTTSYLFDNNVLFSLKLKQATLVWTRKKERRRLRDEKDDVGGGARQKEKRKAKEKVDGFGERRHEKGWS